MGQAVLETIYARDWCSQKPPQLLVHSNVKDNLDELATGVQAIMARCQELGAKKHYSLVTKCLHFLYPEAFVIYDSMIAKSIETWRRLLFEHCGPAQEGEGWQFKSSLICDTGGEGYLGLLLFYRLQWRHLTNEYRVRLKEKADALTTLLRQKSEATQPAVSVVDLIDKLLWHASGHAELLGLTHSTDT